MPSSDGTLASVDSFMSWETHLDVKRVVLADGTVVMFAAASRIIAGGAPTGPTDAPPARPTSSGGPKSALR